MANGWGSIQPPLIHDYTKGMRGLGQAAGGARESRIQDLQLVGSHLIVSQKLEGMKKNKRKRAEINFLYEMIQKKNINVLSDVIGNKYKIKGDTLVQDPAGTRISPAVIETVRQAKSAQLGDRFEKLIMVKKLIRQGHIKIPRKDEETLSFELKKIMKAFGVNINSAIHLKGEDEEFILSGGDELRDFMVNSDYISSKLKEMTPEIRESISNLSEDKAPSPDASEQKWREYLVKKEMDRLDGWDPQKQYYINRRVFREPQEGINPGGNQTEWYILSTDSPEFYDEIATHGKNSRLGEFGKQQGIYRSFQYQNGLEKQINNIDNSISYIQATGETILPSMRQPSGGGSFIKTEVDPDEKERVWMQMFYDGKRLEQLTELEDDSKSGKVSMSMVQKRELRSLKASYEKFKKLATVPKVLEMLYDRRDGLLGAANTAQTASKRSLGGKSYFTRSLIDRMNFWVEEANHSSQNDFDIKKRGGTTTPDISETQSSKIRKQNMDLVVKEQELKEQHKEKPFDRIIQNEIDEIGIKIKENEDYLKNIQNLSPFSQKHWEDTSPDLPEDLEKEQVEKIRARAYKVLAGELGLSEGGGEDYGSPEARKFYHALKDVLETPNPAERKRKVDNWLQSGYTVYGDDSQLAEDMPLSYWGFGKTKDYPKQKFNLSRESLDKVTQGRGWSPDVLDEIFKQTSIRSGGPANKNWDEGYKRKQMIRESLEMGELAEDWRDVLDRIKKKNIRPGADYGR